MGMVDCRSLPGWTPAGRQHRRLAPSVAGNAPVSRHRNSRMNAEPFIAAEALTRVYQRGRDPVRALDNVSFELHTGEFLAVVGPSGSGKTTLLNLLGCLDTPTSGTLRLQGRPIHALP